MEFDLIQLIDDDDDQLLEVPAPESAASVPDHPVSLASSSLPPPPQPRPTVASAAETRNVPIVSQPPSYSEANRPRQRVPIEGFLRSSFVAISIVFIVISVISITLNIVGIIYCSQFAVIGHGILAAVMCLTLSASNVFLIRRRTFKIAIVTLVLASAAFVCTCTMSGLSVRAAVLDSDPSFSKHDCLKYDLNVAFLSSLILALCGFTYAALTIANILLTARVLYIIRQLQRSMRAYCAANYTFYYSAADQHVSGATASAAPPPYSLPEYTPPQLPPPYK